MTAPGNERLEGAEGLAREMLERHLGFPLFGPSEQNIVVDAPNVIAAMLEFAALTPEAERVEIPAGMKPWLGGRKPNDWNGEAVQFRSGEVRHAEPGTVWELGWDHSYGPGDIIAYTPATPAGHTDQRAAAKAVIDEIVRNRRDRADDTLADEVQCVGDQIDAVLAALSPQPSHTAAVEAMREACAKVADDAWKSAAASVASGGGLNARARAAIADDIRVRICALPLSTAANDRFPAKDAENDRFRGGVNGSAGEEG